MRIEDCVADFEILKHLHYMDSAATSLIPEPVIAAMNEYDRHYRANVGRGMHRLTRVATQRYQDAHDSISSFIGGEKGIPVFTRNTTEAINMVALGLDWKPGDRIVTTIVEHHSNLLPWLRLRRKGVEVDVVEPLDPGSDSIFNMDSFEEAITAKTANASNGGTKLVAISHVSNVLGTVLPINEIAALCKEHGAYLLVDAAQSVPHFAVKARKLECDFLCFSGHKMLGPTGTGVLWMRDEDRASALSPLCLGGGTVEDVTVEDYILTEGYRRFEGGTPNIAGAIGLAQATRYLENLGMDAVCKHEEKLTKYLLKGLMDIEQVNVYGPKGIKNENIKNRIGVVSFNIKGIHPHEVAYLLDERAGILVRSGDHCCIPLMRYLGLESGSVRASLYLYNTLEEIDLLLETIEAITRMV
jgi:cysteine desulfurase / selenocysteine lyase